MDIQGANIVFLVKGDGRGCTLPPFPLHTQFFLSQSRRRRNRSIKITRADYSGKKTKRMRRSGGMDDGIENNIICTLCNNYLVEAVTLTECLHFFCRSCLLHHLKSDNRCPKCFQDLGKDLSSAFRPDHTLQKLVYKLVPNFFWTQLKRRRRIKKKAEKKNKKVSRRKAQVTKQMLHLSTNLCSPEEKVSLVLEYVPPSSSAQYLQNDSTNFRRYFRCLAKTPLKHLKKLLEMKLAMTDNYAVYFIDDKRTHVLDDDDTLQDLIYLNPWTRENPLQLLFTLARLTSEEDKPPVLERLDMEMMPQLRAESPDGQKCSPLSPSTSSPPENKLKIPNLSVSLPSTTFENSSAPHPRIITSSDPNETPTSLTISKNTQPQQQIRKRRKNSVTTKKANQNVIEAKTARKVSSSANTQSRIEPKPKNSQTDTHRGSAASTSSTSSSNPTPNGHISSSGRSPFPMSPSPFAPNTPPSFLAAAYANLLSNQCLSTGNPFSSPMMGAGGNHSFLWQNAFVNAINQSSNVSSGAHNNTQQPVKKTTPKSKASTEPNSMPQLSPKEMILFAQQQQQQLQQILKNSTQNRSAENGQLPPRSTATSSYLPTSPNQNGVKKTASSQPNQLKLPTISAHQSSTVPFGGSGVRIPTGLGLASSSTKPTMATT
ncbi:RAWUL domain RING finger- and WD40-associated ubiquitin-like domain-containing protein [Ditylenchus destructor]|uniref:RAWUL domain RING finger- and WD40-associated ubiquitin-like domain-containing protein n=1 Tax=Ditylenchus destructor TaxID=166010 RepID=A0AAD4N4H8_9BILA|nr:RAWUL domain RING finger- and WD40-associated ubiquitin-like domain-containing protein [Ditylenchus destructor]